MKHSIILILIIFLFSCAKETSTTPEVPDKVFETGSFEFGSDAPDFDVLDIDGKAVKLSDFKGKVVVIDFWASWCNICVKAMPEVKQIYEKYKDKDFKMISISLDYKEDALRQALITYGMEWQQIWDEAAPSPNNIASKKYGISGIPSIAVIDKAGKLRYLSYHNKIQVEKAIEQYLQD
jgi:cytochrome oxidase Cu insertion factor (SCO1/SenC/PrrC family)